MQPSKVLAIVLREMNAYGQAWRLDWSDFDGRQLRSQLEGISAWATCAIADDAEHLDYKAGTEFLENADDDA